MRLRTSAHSSKVLDCGDTGIHLGISGIELGYENGFQRSMERGLLCARLIPTAVPPSKSMLEAR
jgi:hypothetical protein